MSDTILVRRRFAVMQEDLFRVPRPTSEDLANYDGDVQAWAVDHITDLYQAGSDSGIEIVTEDAFVADLEFPEPEITVEADQ